MRKILLCLLLCFLIPLWAGAEDAAGPVLESGGLELMSCSVSYPKVTGLADEAVQQQVNDALLEAGHVRDTLDRVSLAAASGEEITLTWQGEITGEVLSCSFSLSLPEGRACYGVVLDLRDGHRVSLEELAEVTGLEELAEDIAGELSPHLPACELTPLPEDFTADRWGITLYYPAERYTTLQGESGCLHLSWAEIPAPVTAEDGIPDRLGVLENLTLTGADAVVAALEDGKLPGSDLKLGEPAMDWLPESTEPKAPDLYTYGRILSFENGALRGWYLLTDDLGDTLENSLIQGIRSDRIALCGLVTGVTRQEDWRQVLGEPEAELTLDEDAAEGMRMVPGISDYYVWNGLRLRLHADEEGVLRSVILTY